MLIINCNLDNRGKHAHQAKYTMATILFDSGCLSNNLPYDLTQMLNKKSKKIKSFEQIRHLLKCSIK